MKILLLLLPLLFSQLTLAQPIDASIKNKIATCKACHGVDGIARISTYPSLRGQNKGYLIASLKAYKNRQRSGGLAVFMQQQVDPLSDQDIEAIAEYYSSLK